METQTNKKDYWLPVSIILAALLISGALIYNVGKPDTAVPEFGGEGDETSLLDKVQPVSPDDHILGKADAPVKVIEFSDLECPFCKTFHGTMERVFNEYQNQITWVYRHFPLDTLHPKARLESLATECVASLGGNEKFWQYLKEIFAITPSNNQLDLQELPRLAVKIGIFESQFKQCQEDKTLMSRVDENLKDAFASGGRGTPFTIVIGKNGAKYLINGAQPYEQVKLIIDRALLD